MAVVMEPLQAESHQLIQHNAKLQAQESTRVIGNPDQHPKKRAEQVVRLALEDDHVLCVVDQRSTLIPGHEVITQVATSSS